MIVILASRWDQTAGAFAAHCAAARSVGILTCRDLCTSGWRQRLGGGMSDTVVCDAAVAQRRVMPQREITGVLTRLRYVAADELVEISAQDRDYVAAEMTAFLLFWLSRLTCPVLNRPTPMCLSGPNWRAEQWVHAAAHAGIPVKPLRRNTSSESHAATPVPVASRSVTVIGERTFGEADPHLRQQARRLAELAGVALLSVHFSSAERGARFLGADAFPALDDDALRDAALDYLCGASAETS
jgi:hypothetical protein